MKEKQDCLYRSKENSDLPSQRFTFLWMPFKAASILQNLMGHNFTNLVALILLLGFSSISFGHSIQVNKLNSADTLFADEVKSITASSENFITPDIATPNRRIEVQCSGTPSSDTTICETGTANISAVRVTPADTFFLFVNGVYSNSTGTGTGVGGFAQTGHFINGDTTTTTLSFFPAPIPGGSQRIDTILVLTDTTGTVSTACSDTIYVTVKANPVVNAGKDTIICEGTPITLSPVATNATTLTWSNLSGIGTFSNNDTTYTSGGNITTTTITDSLLVKTDDPSGVCVAAMDTLNLTFIKKPFINLSADFSLCGDPSGIINPDSIGLGNKLTWFSNNGTFNDATLDTPIYLPNFPVASNIRIDQIIASSRDSFGMGICPVAMDTILVQVFEVARITTGTTSTVCEGDTVLLNGNYFGNLSDFTYIVSGNNGKVLVQNLKIIYIPNAISGIGNRIDFVDIFNPDKDGNGICVADTSKVIVRVEKVAKAVLVSDTTICEGERINLIVEQFGSQDTFSSNLSTSLTNYPFTIPILQNDTSIKDTVVFGTLLGTCPNAIDKTIITINSLDTIALNLSDTTICEVGTVMLNSGIIITGINHTWQVLGSKGTFNDSTSTTPVYTPNTGLTTTSRIDTLILNVVDSTNRCLTGKDTFLITILGVGSVTTIIDTTICLGDSLALNVILSGELAQFSWASNNGTFINSADPMSKYVPNVFAANNRKDTIIANLTFTNNACSTVRDTAIITVINNVEVNAGTDTAICQGFSYQLSGSIGIGAISANWSVLQAAGIFNNTTQLNAIYTPIGGLISTNRIDTLILTTNDPDGTGNCVAGRDTVLITVIRTPTITLGQDTTLFNGHSFVINASLSDAVLTSKWTSNKWQYPKQYFRSGYLCA